jgi:hypothetical protein
MEIAMAQALALTVTPSWDSLDTIREETQKVLGQEGFNEDIQDSIVMIISELAENAVKYGHFHNSKKDIRATIDISRNEITVEVQSPVDEEDSPHFKRLDKTIQWIRGYQNPFEAYIERIRDISIRPVSDRESGLGLVRIAYEGQSVLDFYVDDKYYISVSAVYQR